MKTSLLPAALALALILPAIPVRAAGEGRTWNVLVVDKDPKGANLREAPSGKVITIIPFKKGPRIVDVTGQAADWFKVETNGVSGWMHGSVLGTCASGTEDGDPSLSRSPRNDSPAAGPKFPAGTPVTLVGMEGTWLKVRYTDGKGRKQEGWLPEQALAGSENELEMCAKAWARK